MGKKKDITYSRKDTTSVVSESMPTYSSANNYDEIFQKIWATLNNIAERQKKFEEEQELKAKEWEEYEKKRAKEWEEYKKENHRRIKQLDDLFTSQWGKLIEALLSPGCKKIFQDRGIQIHYSGSNVIAEFGDRRMEIDVLLENEQDVVIVEVKTTAKVKHVKELVRELKEIKNFFPRFEGKNVYGAMAALRFHEESDKYAASQGLFVIEPSGENFVRIRNQKNFEPKKW